MKIKNSKLWIISLIMICSCSTMTGCGEKQAKTPMKGFFQELTAWDNTEARAKKLHNNYYKPLAKISENYDAVCKNSVAANQNEATDIEKIQQFKNQNLPEAERLLEEMPKEANSTKKEGQQVRYANEFAKAVIMKLKSSDQEELKAAQIAILNSKLGYDNAYSLLTKGKGTYELYKYAYKQLKVGRDYSYVASLFKMPGKHIKNITVQENGQLVENELYIFANGEAYVLAEFRDNKLKAFQENGLW